MPRDQEVMQPASMPGGCEVAQVWGGLQSQACALLMCGGQDSLERGRSCLRLEQTKVTRKLNTQGRADM